MIESAAPQVVPVVYPSGGSESYSHRSEKVIQSSAPQVVPVVYPTGGSESYHSRSEKVISSGSAAPIVTVYPSGGNEHYSQSSFSESTGGSVPLAPIVSYPSGESSFATHRSERVHQAVPVTVPVFPTGGSSSRYLSSQVSLTLKNWQYSQNNRIYFHL